MAVLHRTPGLLRHSPVLGHRTPASPLSPHRAFPPTSQPPASASASPAASSPGFLPLAPLGHSPLPKAAHPGPKHRAGGSAQGGGRRGRARRQGGQGAGPRQPLTFTLLTPSTAAAVAEAGVLVRGREAGRGPRVLVGVALAQGPGGGRVGQRGQHVLVRGPTGAAVEGQGGETWRGGGRVRVRAGGRALWGTPARSPTHCCTGPRRRSSTARRR